MIFEKSLVTGMNSEKKLKQLKEWQNSLMALRQENTLLKIKLSELVDNSVMTDFLSKAEVLNNELLSNDTTINLLMEVADHISNQAENITHFNAPELAQRHRELGIDIEKFKERFRNLSDRFQRELKTA